MYVTMKNSLTTSTSLLGLSHVRRLFFARVGLGQVVQSMIKLIHDYREF